MSNPEMALLGNDGPNDAVVAFADCARRYCNWARERLADASDEVDTALALLSELNFRALALPHAEWQDNPEDSERSEWEAVLRRFAALPFQLYELPTSPAALEWAGEVGDLQDDLADIWRYLHSGLNLFDRGQPGAAAYFWRSFYWGHWGRHANAALYALHAWVADRCYE
ncbi:DUF5063 domain-containing protein [Lysobacter firmicutimachus]|uniref:DUF5063 domain-containing protein n=1 Tax=Lysobacter firmicutimachus TaxID=1792846 RepID=A0AAU8MNI8_9GAMM